MDISDWRKKIDEVDAAVLKLVNLRADMAHRNRKAQIAGGNWPARTGARARNRRAHAGRESGAAGRRIDRENLRDDRQPVYSSAGAQRRRALAAAGAG